MSSFNLHHLHKKCNKQGETEISANSALQINHKLNLKRKCSSREETSKEVVSINLSPLKQIMYPC